MSNGLTSVEYVRLNAARRAYERARAWYVRRACAERTAKRLSGLQREWSQLLAASARLQSAETFHAARIARAQRAFAEQFPQQPVGAGVRRPTVLDRIRTRGRSDRVYRELRVWMFCRDEANAELRATRDRLAIVAARIEAVVRSETVALERRLAEPAGLRAALAADPQLALAHARLAQIVESVDS